MPKVSICVPAYCQVDFLRLTLESVRIQKFKDYELIITDDSPDDSVRNLLASFNFDHHLRYFKNAIPLGSPRNWNEAVAKANGELIKILHHDDKFAHANALHDFVRLMDDNPHADFGFCNSQVIDITTNKTRVHGPSVDQLQMISDTPELLFVGNVIGAPSATIYRRSLAMLEYDQHLKWLVDIDFYIRMLQKNRNFAYTNEILIITPTNAVHQVTESCKSNAELEIWEYSILYLKNAFHLRNHKAAVNQWLGIFGRYGIYSVEQIPNFSRFGEYQQKLLEETLETFNSRPVLRMVYFLYWQLKMPPLIKFWLQTLIQLSFRIFSITRSLMRRLKKIQTNRRSTAPKKML